MSDTEISMPAVNEKLGVTREGQDFYFRLFAPAAEQVELLFFAEVDQENGTSFSMMKKENGVWENRITSSQTNKYYAYRLNGNPTQIADPYALAVVRQNHYLYPTKSITPTFEDFNWEGDSFTRTPLKDMIILEAHLRDMSVHPSSEADHPGSYLGFIDPDQKGGIAHLKDMGYNAVEFLPIQEFGNIEIDFKNPELATYNDWNPYENNHWGYMTSYFFAPEIYYGSDGSRQRGDWVGQDGRAVTEMKEMVKALHREGISVILDVVYNHVSQYDANPYKLIDKDYYFRLNENGDYLSASGCGNDFKTENEMSRKMIVESLCYWMEEYHIDGFRFDLAAMIDMETVDAITKATQAINPEVVLIGEPWGGGGYNPAQLADHGWASWNDHFRNSVKGRSPRENDSGLIFGRLWDGNNIEHYKKLQRGYLQHEGGHYRKPVQSINYLESHDDHTLGDFVRLTLGKVGEHEVVTRDQVAKLSDEELRIHKFAAFNLLVSQGPVMVSQGQSWGRAKVIANSIGTDPRAGQLDHNSYEKDDETNWLDWTEKALNAELVDYYRGLITLRSTYDILRDVNPTTRSFNPGPDGYSYSFSLGNGPTLLVLVNGNGSKAQEFMLPAGEWIVLADGQKVYESAKGQISGAIPLPALSGVILKKS